MKIGVFFTNETRSTAEEITYTLIQEYPSALAIKYGKTEGIFCHLENGDTIRMVRMNEYTRGNKFDMAYVPKTVDTQYLNEVIRPIVFNEIKFYEVKTECEFHHNYKKGDALYINKNDLAFICIDNIKYCPLCGKELK